MMLILGVLGAAVAAVAVLENFPRPAGGAATSASTSDTTAATLPPVAQAAPPSPAPLAESPAEVMLLLDASGSMFAEDFEMNGTGTSRFEVLRHETAEFIKNHPKVRMGAVAFPSAAYVLSGPTEDHTNLLAALDRLKGGKLGADGTAIGSAIVAGYAQMADEGDRKRVMILVTDGDNNTGFIAPATAAEIAAEQKIALLAIGLGRNGMAPYPMTDPFGKKSYTSIKLSVDETGLRHLADVMAGRYLAAPNTRALADAFRGYEAVNEKCPAARFTASVPERFASSFGTVSVVGDTLVRKGLPTPANSLVLPKVGPDKAASATPTAAPAGTPGIATAPTPTAPPVPPVSASLSTSVARVGETVTLTIAARELPAFPPPKDFSVDGLEVKYSETASSMALRDGKMSQSREYRYAVTGQRAGAFVIPIPAVSIGRQSYQAAPVKLTVRNAAPGAAPPPASAVSPAGTPGIATAPTPGAPAVPSVSASLSTSVAHVGESVTLTIAAQELPNFPPPKDFSVDGLELKYSGTATSMALRDGKMSQSREYRYSVTAQRTGTFDIAIPAVSIGREKYQAAPVKLTVRDAAPGETYGEAPAFAEIVPASDEAKVGKLVGVEIRLGVDRKVRWEPTGLPVFVPDGFLRDSMPAPEIKVTSKNGSEYNVLTFQTSLTPLKSGQFTVGPVTLYYHAHKLAHLENDKNPFGNLFSDRFLDQTESRTIQAPAVTIDVQP